MLFTRTGEEFKGQPDNSFGKPVRWVNVACDRCHVIGGQRLWVMGTENGRPFSKTGFSCWTCGNTGIRKTVKERLYTEAELARVNKSASTRAARKAEANRIAAEQAEAARAAKDAEFRAANAEFIAKLADLDGEFWIGFRESFLRRAAAPTERQVMLVDAEVTKRAANASSGFVGAVGDKVTLTLTIERIVGYQTAFGAQYIHICRTHEGSVVTYKGTANIGATDDTVTLTATVKDHTVYQGVKQTVIQRPKLVNPT